MKIGTKKQPESVILQAVRNALVIDGKKGFYLQFSLGEGK